MPEHGLHVPRWAIVAAAMGLALISGTFAAAAKVIRADERVNMLDIRLCRIETALQIPPWPSCR